MIVLKPPAIPDRIAFSPDGALLGASSTGLMLSVFDAASGKLLWRTEPREYDNRTGDVSFSPDSRSVCLAWKPEDVYDARTGRAVAPADRRAEGLPGGGSWKLLKLDTGVASRIGSPDGRWSTGGQSLQLNDHDTGWSIDLFPFMGRSPNDKATFPIWAVAPLAFSPDSALLACADNTRLHVFRREDLLALAKADKKRTETLPVTTTVATLKSVRKHFQSAAFTPDGRGIMTGTNDGLVRVWDTTTWQERHAYDWKCGPVRWMIVTADSTRAAVAGTRKIVIWDLDS